MKSFDGKDIYTRLWEDVAEPIGVVQICHGLGEHSGRYDHFARFLNANGYIVFADDHRAHGHTDNGSGDCQGEPAVDTVQDLLFFNRWLRERYPRLPLIFFGHSYGSSLAHRFIQFPSSICACVMTGVNMMPHGMLKAMGGLMYLAKSVAPGKLISMTSDSMNKRFPDRDVPHAWLTRDPEIRKEYEADPFCGTPSSLRFNHSMTKMMCQATDPENLKKVPDSLPIAMFCGEDDSAGGFGKGPKTALEIYRKYGKNITLKLYPGARHEVLNEINRDEIYQDILSFLNSVVEK
jgi:alpha-beta hydrolase superfamily lysophospholipase